MPKRINEQIGPFSAIEAEAHLFEVGREMLRGNLMPRSHDSALEKREGGFDGIGVQVSDGIDALAVSNLLVIFDTSFLNRRVIRGCIISENHLHILADILADVPCERAALRISGMEEAKIAVALADADDHFFVVHASDATFPFVYAADIGSVQFHFAVEHRLIGLGHGMADAMAEVPRRLVAHSDRALNLASGHALLCFAEQVRGQKPLTKWQVGIVENRARSDGELIVAILAVEELLFGFQFDYWPFAAQALRAIGPAETDKQLAALIFGRKESVYIN